MFYRLLTINGASPPASLAISGGLYAVTHGGLLLSPLDVSDASVPAEGHSILKFFGQLRPDVVEFLGSSTESYWWRSADALDISRRGSELGTRFSGRRSENHLDLVAEGGAEFVPTGTRLGFIAAPTDVITADWRDTFDSGAVFIAPADATLRDDPRIQAAIREAVLASDSSQRHTAAARLELALRAPV